MLDPAPGAPSASPRRRPGEGSRSEGVTFPTHRTGEQTAAPGVRWSLRVRVCLGHHPVHVEDRTQPSFSGPSPPTAAVRRTHGLGVPGTVRQWEAVRSGAGPPPPGGQLFLPRTPTRFTANGPTSGTSLSASVRRGRQYLPQGLWGFGHSTNKGAGTQYVLSKSR